MQLHGQTALGPSLQAAEYFAASRSDNTLRAYRSDWQQFIGWCNRRRLASLLATEATVCRYLAERAEQDKVSTLARRSLRLCPRKKIRRRHSH